MKQAVISPSALSLMYPENGIAGYPREAFIEDLSASTSPRSGVPCRPARTPCKSISPRLGSPSRSTPTGGLLASFIDLNNLALSRLSPAERSRVGVHTCPGGDRDSTHSADVDYAELFRACFSST